MQEPKRATVKSNAPSAQTLDMYQKQFEAWLHDVEKGGEGKVEYASVEVFWVMGTSMGLSREFLDEEDLDERDRNELRPTGKQLERINLRNQAFAECVSELEPETVDRVELTVNFGNGAMVTFVRCTFGDEDLLDDKP